MKPTIWKLQPVTYNLCFQVAEEKLRQDLSEKPMYTSFWIKEIRKMACYRKSFDESRLYLYNI